MKNYEINEGTLAILSKSDGSSTVYEDDKEYIVEKSAFEIMENSCNFFGSSYSGRVEGAEYILGGGYKMPIIVDEIRNIIFFPTVSPSSVDCTWLAINHIKSIENQEAFTKILFNNNINLSLPISYRSIQNQLYRAARLDSIIRSRKK